MATTPDIRSVVTAGAGAAGLLEGACNRGLDSDDDPKIELVRDLAKDIKDQLEALARLTDAGPPPDLMAEAALRCADLSNLAAGNLDGLPADGVPEAAASVHLAAGTVRALRLLAEAEAGNLTGMRAAVLRDVRGAGWRVDLATRQVEEFLEADTEA